MAEMYTPEEIQDVFKRYNEEMANTGRVSKAMAQEMADAQKGVKNYTYQLNQSLKQLGTSLKTFGKSMKDGQTGASTFNDSIESGADAIDKFASKFGIIGAIIGGVVKAASAYTVAVNKQADALYKSYQDLSKFGAAGAGGMTELFGSMQKFGYGIEQLGEMTALLKDNVGTLSKFGGTVADGSRQFADLASQIQRSEIGRQFQLMGMSIDDINRGAAGYIKQQQGYGQTTSQVNKNLAASAAAYIKELDVMARLTGESREQQEQRIADAQAEEAFNQTQYELKQKAAAGDQEAAALYRKNEELNRRLTGEALTEFRKGVGGDVSAMSKTLLTAPDAVQGLTSAAQTADDYINQLAKGAKNTRDQMGGLAKVNSFSDTFINLREISDLQARYGEESAEAQKERAKRESDLAAQGIDPVTKNMTDMAISQRNARDALQSMINLGIKPVTSAMAGLAKVTEKAAGLAPGTPGGGKAIGGSQNRGTAADARSGKSAASTEAGKTAGTTATPGAAGSLANIREMIAGVESKGDYNVIVGGKKAPLTAMTVQQVLDMQQDLINQGGDSAAGKYQIKRSTLLGLVQRLGIDTSSKFDAATQDKLADELIKGRGYGAYASGKMTKEEFLTNLSKEWAGLPSNASGSSYYAGVGNNKAGVGWDQALGSFANGGISSGPMGGYQAMLHGTEAVVPLPNGKSIPVEMQGMMSSFNDQNGLMAQQITRLDELISVMRNQVSISQKILNYTQ